MDSLLIDPMHLHAGVWKIAFMEVGIDIDEREIFSLESGNEPGIVKKILDSSRNDADRFDELMELVPQRKHKLFDRDASIMHLAQQFFGPGLPFSGYTGYPSNRRFLRWGVL